SGLTRTQVKAMFEEAFSSTVLLAEDGAIGWDVLSKNPDVELIVSDIEMPGMNGVEFVQKIRGSEQFMYLPIIVMSTLGQVKERDDALNSGADAFIEKPVTTETLQRLIRDIW
ncbi:MAG: response regulator, partial [Proteobacteria bacterium]|nr:response regulator [Pseudomonadota bacterium]